MSLQSRKHSPVCDKDELRQKEKEEEHPGSLKANHNGLPKSIPTLSGTLSFPSFLRPAKDVPQSISGRDKLHKHDLHNVVAVMEAQASLRQKRTQAEGERRRTQVN
ncbi:hypothetical protein JHK86_055072 [Glycine max]|nr:hypothetical protein JHK86_055072 [Glycine max]